MLCSIGLIVDLPRLGADEPARARSWSANMVSRRGARPTGDWIVAATAVPDPAHTSRLIAKPGQGTLINGVTGKTRNLLTIADFGDVDAHVEFLIPKGSNSGVKFEGLYEIQIVDSFGIAKPDAEDCGGIYPRAELLPRYHYLDEGTPPLLNAARSARGVANARCDFPRPSFRLRRQEDQERQFRKGRPERPGHPPARRAENAHRSLLARQGSRAWADIAPR